MKCLGNLRQATPRVDSWEVLVMDNSEDIFRVQNAAVVASFQDTRFRYVPMKSWGLMAARHQGVELALGHIVSFIDDDSFVSATWLCGVQQAFDDPNVVLVGGPNRPQYETAPPSWLNHLWAESEFGNYLGYLSLLDFGATEKNIPPTFVWGCNYTLRKKIFDQVQGSHPDYLPKPWELFQGDGEVGLSVKIGALGYQARYCPQCAIQHWVPTARMTPDYLGTRAYFIGLHCSFTEIRRKHGLGPAQGVQLAAPRSPSAKQLMRTLLGRLKKRLRPHSDTSHSEPEDIAAVRRHIRDCYARGWNFHQRAVATSPALLEYVLRSNYLGNNGQLPGPIEVGDMAEPKSRDRKQL